jgi:UDP-N-acetylmuramate dehydrogenase
MTNKSDAVREMAVQLWNHYAERIKLNEPLKHYTTYKVGGPATALCFPATREELQDMLSLCHQRKVPVYILGSGSNILVHDIGIDMIVFKLDQCCAELSRDGQNVYTGAGMLVSGLVEFCEEQELAGLDFMSGIPGTVGGALRMNAGAFVGEIGDRVVFIDAMDYQGNGFRIKGEDAGFGYRRADNLQDKIMLGCQLQLIDGRRDDLQKSRKDYLSQRAAKQPLDYGSCGSVFKRPPGNYAGTLIEKAGCKGMRIGGAMVSPKHANFIINYDRASADDIYQLIREVQNIVYRRFNIWLELEVKLLGFSDEEEKKVRKAE